MTAPLPRGLPTTPVALTASVPAGYAQQTITATASQLTVPAGASLALLSVEGGDVRFRDDGTDPTASSGFRLPAGFGFRYAGDLSALRFVLASGSPVLNVLFYRA